MKIGLYGKQIKKEHKGVIEKIISIFSESGIEFWLSKALVNFTISENVTINKDRLIVAENIPSDLKFLMSIGGDGTFLDAFAGLNMKNIPLIGINTGRLGFLADILPCDIEKSLNNLISQNYHIEKRSILKAQLIKSQELNFPYAINDITIHKSDSSSMIKIHTYIQDEYLTTYWSDGLIISTPIGSTAYSMSAGGPIVTPDSNSFIITPIANHNLTVRPLVIPDTAKISIEAEARDSKILLSLDSRSYVTEEKLSMYILKAKSEINLVKFADLSYYKTLRNKLMWGVDKRN